MRNTGKSSEGQFVASYEKAGAFVHRFADKAELVGRNRGRIVNVPEQPSDYLVVDDGYMFLAEVKSSSDPDRFSFSMLRPAQRAAGIKTTLAGGCYFVFAHRLDTGAWYRIPYGLIRDRDLANVKSLRWDELEPFAWSFPS